MRKSDNVSCYQGRGVGGRGDGRDKVPLVSVTRGGVLEAEGTVEIKFHLFL